MDTNLIITLLTIAVVLLSLVMITILVIATIVLVKVKRAVNNISSVSKNLSAITAWFSPGKVFTEAVKAFRK